MIIRCTDLWSNSLIYVQEIRYALRTHSYRWRDGRNGIVRKSSVAIHADLVTEKPYSTITYDVLVRGGVKTTSVFVPDLSSATVSVSPPAAKGSRGINIIPDSYLDFGECGPVSAWLDLWRCKNLIETQDKYDLLVIPGGAKGAETMSKSPAVQELVRRYIKERKFVGMICAGVFSLTSSFQTFLSLFSFFFFG